MSAMTQGTTNLDPMEFRRAMSTFASGVNIITVRDSEGDPHGMTATAFCSVSTDPPLVLICVNRDTRTHDMIVESGRFGVSMLSGESTEISNHCARPGEDKRLPLAWLRDDARSATPALGTALVHVDCTIHDRRDAGTHAVFIGRVEHIDFGDSDEPLLYFQGSYGRLVAEG